MPFLPAVDPTIISLIRDDLQLTTWLSLGACLQSFLILLLPAKYAMLPAAAVVGYRFTKTALMTVGLIHDTTQDKVLQGRFTAQLPPVGSEQKKADEEMVVFIIGARSNQ